MTYSDEDFAIQLRVTLDSLDRVSSRAEFFEVSADEVAWLISVWGESHWDAIAQAAEDHPLFARGIGSVVIPPARRMDARVLLERLGIERDLHITIRVTQDGPNDGVSYHLGKVVIDETFPVNVLEEIVGALPEHLRIVTEREVSRRKRRSSASD